MRAFVFVAAGARYALDAACIQAVHPLVQARSLPGAPAWLLGVADVHGEMVPLVDACQLLASQAVQRTMGSRVLLVDTGVVPDQVRARFALAVDRVLDPAEIEMDGAWRAGSGAVPWLGAVVAHGQEAAQVFHAPLLAQAFRQLAAPESQDAAALLPGGGA